MNRRRSAIVAGLVMVVIAVLLPVRESTVSAVSAGSPGARSSLEASSALAWGKAPDAVAALVHRDTGNDDLRSGQFCGGSLVSQFVVLTAAHCVSAKQPDDIDVILGATNLCDDGDGTRSHVARIELGPEGSDSAALVLTRATHYEPFDVPSAVPAFPFDAVSYGWGDLTSIRKGPCAVKAISLRFTKLSDCKIAALFDNPTAPSYDLCARPTRSEKLNTCSGDSGGPSVISGAHGEAEVIGLTDWGASCGKFAHGGYTNTVALRSWFQPIIASAEAGQDGSG